MILGENLGLHCISGVLFIFFFFFFFGSPLTQDPVSTGITINAIIKMLLLLLLIPATIVIFLSLSLNHHRFLFVLRSERD